MKTHISKQLFGAVLGMVIASTVYVAVDQSSFNNIKGYLISDPRIKDSSTVVVTNRSDVESQDVELVTRRTAAIEAKLRAVAAEEVEPNTLMNQHARARADMRAKEDQTEIRVQTTGKSVEAPGTQTVMETYDRLRLRNARVIDALQQAKTGADLYQPNMEVITPAYKPFQAVAVPSPTPGESFKGKGVTKFKVPQEVPIVPVVEPAAVVRDVPVMSTKRVQTTTSPSPKRTVADRKQVETKAPSKLPLRQMPTPVPGVQRKHLPDSGPLFSGLVLISIAGALACTKPELLVRLKVAFQHLS